jgi:FkbM family methyltransferase
MPVTNLKLPYRVLLALFRIAPLNRGVFRRHWINFLKKRVKHAIRTNFRGVPFYFHLDNPTEQKGLFNYYNLGELDFLTKIVDSKAATFVDVGANSGFYSQIMLYRAAPGAKVIAIEPNPAMCERIRKNISLIQDHMQDRKLDFALENCAAGPDESTMHLDLDGGLGGAHIVNQPTATSLEVKVDKLLNILHRHRVTSVDALKIDVEGFEDRVLIPFFSEAERSLFPGHIVIEHTSDRDWSEDLWGCLRQAGYKEVFRTRGNAILRLENPTT